MANRTWEGWTHGWRTWTRGQTRRDPAPMEIRLRLPTNQAERDGPAAPAALGPMSAGSIGGATRNIARGSADRVPERLLQVPAEPRLTEMNEQPQPQQRVRPHQGTCDYQDPGGGQQMLARWIYGLCGPKGAYPQWLRASLLCHPWPEGRLQRLPLIRQAGHG